MDEKERNRTLTATLGQIEKQFGKGLHPAAGGQRGHRTGLGNFKRFDFG